MHARTCARTHTHTHTQTCTHTQTHTHTQTAVSSSRKLHRLLLLFTQQWSKSCSLLYSFLSLSLVLCLWWPLACGLSVQVTVEPTQVLLLGHVQHLWKDSHQTDISVFQFSYSKPTEGINNNHHFTQLSCLCLDNSRHNQQLICLLTSNFARNIWEENFTQITSSKKDVCSDI